MSGHYILDGKRPVPVSMDVWAVWFGKADRKVEITKIDDEVSVSTVFLGLDHSFGHGPPMVFETLVFGGEHDGEMSRYSTWEQAVNGHFETVDRLTGNNIVPLSNK